MLIDKDNVIRLLFCIIIIVAGCSGKEYPDLKPSDNSTHTYYVSPNGNDSNSGTLDTPLRGINTALNKAIPGDTVLVRGGIYHQKVFFPKTGRADKYITLKAYPGEKPVIDGTGLSITGKEALVTIRSVNYIVFEGFDVCNYKSSAPWVNINGILADEGSGNISIRKNRIYNIEHNVKPEDGRSGHGIEILGNTNVAMKNILVEENEIFDCNTGYSENLTINGYVDGFIITSSSPAKNTGVVISADINGSTDIDGNARIINNKISKGALQVQGSLLCKARKFASRWLLWLSGLPVFLSAFATNFFLYLVTREFRCYIRPLQGQVVGL